MTRAIVLGAFTMLAVGSSPAPDTTRVVAGNTQFACDLYAQLKSQSGNVFFSPLSLSSALSMTAAGAKGETLSEMSKTLHLSEDANTHPAFAALFGQINAKANAGYELSIANALWGQKGFPFRPEFKDVVAKNYQGGLRDVDFHQPGSAAGAINHWCAAETKDRIKDLVSPDALAADTRLVLTNAIYFKGDWLHKFKKDMTRDDVFFESESAQHRVPMMYQSREFNYAEHDGVQVLEMSYKGDRLSMVLLLPKEKHGLANVVEPKLNSEWLAKATGGLRAKDGQVILPRFEFRTSYSLASTLRDMGMKLAFSDRADFSGITSSEQLKIDAVIHKAFVKTDEEGSEAAAATAITMRPTAAIPNANFHFRADHPFIFLIRDRQTGSILFMGRVSNPA